MKKSTAKAIEAEAVWKRLPHHLPLPELWQEIQREAQEQLVSGQGSRFAGFCVSEFCTTCRCGTCGRKFSGRRKCS